MYMFLALARHMKTSTGHDPRLTNQNYIGFAMIKTTYFLIIHSVVNVLTFAFRALSLQPTYQSRFHPD